MTARIIKSRLALYVSRGSEVSKCKLVSPWQVAGDLSMGISDDFLIALLVVFKPPCTVFYGDRTRVDLVQ